MPDYYKSKINVAILLAPVATMHNGSSATSRFMAQEQNMKLIAEVAEKLNVLNWFPHSLFTTGPEMLFC